MTVGIIGLGYVGLTLAIALADKGVTVYGAEINGEIKNSLKKNKAHFFEPGLDAIIERTKHKTFFVTDDFPKDVHFDVFVITVGTPLIKGEKEPNFEYIKSSLSSIGAVYDGSQLVILRSTVSVGTTRRIVIPYLSEICGKELTDIHIAMCPERTIEGKAIEELSELPQIISGNNEQSLLMAEKTFRHLTTNIIAVDSLEEAELVKLYCNVYRDTTFAVGNVLCMAAQEFGVDGAKIIKAANKDYHRSNITMPGFVSGPCLEKDAYLLTNNMPECRSKAFILGARGYNEYLEDIVVRFVEKRLKNPANKTVAISGLAFKGMPETSDLRGSASVYIAKKLKAKGFKLKLHDFAAYKHEIEALELGIFCGNFESLCADTELLLILNNHRNYLGISYKDMEKTESYTVFDAWSVCKNLRGANVKTFGNILIDED